MNFKLSDYGVMVGVNIFDCWDFCIGDFVSLGDLCCVIFCMFLCFELFNI